MIWEDIDLEKLSEYKLDNVYKTQSDLKSGALGKEMTYIKYLRHLLNCFTQKILELDGEKKEKLVI